MNKIFEKDLLLAELLNKIASQIFLLSLFIWIFAFMLRNTLWNIPVLNDRGILYLRILCLILLAIKEMIQINIKVDFSIITVCVYFILVVIITYFTKDFALLVTAVFIFSARNMSLDQILKLFIIEALGMLILTILASKLGILENRIFFKSDGTLRNGLGFMYTTYPSQWMFFITTAVVSLRGNRMRYVEAGILWGVSVLLFLQTHTANPFICSTILLLLVVLLRSHESLTDNKYIVVILKNSFVIAAFVMIILTIFYSKNSVFSFLDRVFSNRLRLGFNGIQEYGFSIFGQSIVLTGTVYGMSNKYQPQYNYIDSSYLQIAIKYGFVMLLFLCLGFRSVLKKALKTKDIFLCISLLAIAIQSMLDPQLFTLAYNILLLTLGGLFLISKRVGN